MVTLHGLLDFMSSSPLILLSRVFTWEQVQVILVFVVYFFAQVFYFIVYYEILV